MLSKSFDILLDGAELHVLFVTCDDHASLTETAEQLYNQNRTDITNADLLVVRPCVSKPLQLDSAYSQEWIDFIQRAERLPLHILYSIDYGHQLSGNLNRSVNDIVTSAQLPQLLELLREAELRGLAYETNAILRAADSCFFRAPSKKYCKLFIRVGNVQRDKTTLDAFFFWMLPWLKDCRAILTETWSISSIALNAAQMLTRYDPRVKHCRVEMLATYHDGSAEVSCETEKIIRRITVELDGAVLVLVSACMSGYAMSRLEETIRNIDSSPVRFRYLCLYKLRPTISVQALCDLSGAESDLSFECFDDLPDQQHETSVVDIDRASYFPLTIHEKLVNLKADVARPLKELLDVYKRAGVFSVHRYSYLRASQRLRHHAIYVDTMALLEQATFLNRLRSTLLSLVNPPSLIITPPHEAGEALGRVAQEMLSAAISPEVQLFHHLNLNFPKERNADDDRIFHAIRAVKGIHAILILDDVSVTGRRLTRYQKSLRDIDYSGQIHYMVGIARPEDDEHWERRSRDLAHRSGPGPKHTLSYVDKIVLPNWDEKECPWCRELVIYNKLAQGGQVLTRLILERMRDVSCAGDGMGLQSNLFFRLQEEPYGCLGPNSVLAPQHASEAEVFAAVASTIQRMRTDADPHRRLASCEYPIVSVIDPRDPLGNTFSESIIRAAIIRASKRVELERIKAEDERARTNMVKQIIFDTERDINNLTLELFLGIAMRKLPPISVSSGELEELRARGLDGLEFLWRRGG
jgi:hypothetical protein